MKNIDLGSQDEGLQTFTYNGKEITIDLLDMVYKLQEIKTGISAEGGNSSGELLDKVKDLLQAEGLENVTKTAASKFIAFINALVLDVKKNIEQSVLSRPSTPASTSSTQ